MKPIPNIQVVLKAKRPILLNAFNKFNASFLFCYLGVLFVILSGENLNAQTFSFANYNTSPGAGSTANYTETSSGVTMTLSTATTGTAGWAPQCGYTAPGYGASCYGASGLFWSLNWGNLTSDVTGTFTFSTAISCVSFTIYDINRNPYNATCGNIWTDVIEVTGFNGAAVAAPTVTQSNSSDQAISLSGNTRIATGTEGSVGSAVTYSFSTNVTSITIKYKSGGPTISSQYGCPAGTTDPRQQYIVIGAITGNAANYGVINGGNVTSCIAPNPSPIVFSSLPSGTPSYQWYSKPGINACPNGTSTTGWSLISGATSATYDPPALTSSMTYACLVTVTGCGTPPATWASGCKTITVDNTNATISPVLGNGDYLWQGAPSSAVANVIVDDINAVFYGTGWTASANAGFYGSGSKNSLYIGVSGTPTRWVYFYPTIVTPGRYEVFEKHVGSSNRSAAAPVKLSHANGITSTTVNQESNTNSAADITTWTSLGTYYFNAGNDGYVYYENVGDATSEYLNVDAVAFVFRGSNIYETATNWLEYDGTSFFVATVAPTTSDHVFIKQTGACVNGFPTVTTTGAQSNDITIGTNAQLTSNNATNLTVAGSWSNSGTYIENQGKISFTGNSKTLTCSGGETFYDLSSANTSVLNLNNNITVLNGLWLNGVIGTGANRVWLNTTNIDGISSGVIDGNYTGHIFGTFRRTIQNNNATYRFPVGVTATLNTGRRLMEYINNGVVGPSHLDCFASYPFKGSGNNVDSQLDPAKSTEWGQFLNFVHPEAVWTLTPGAAFTSGSYGVRLYVQNFISPLPQDNKFAVLKRPTGSTTFFDFNAYDNSTTIPNGGQPGRIYASGNGYAEKLGFTQFSEFVIASAPLPLSVELKEFAINCNSGNSILSWSTASEFNNDYYTVERSFMGSDFELISKVDGNGSTSNEQKYMFTDANPKRGISYYRLTQFDYDGQREVLGTLSSEWPCTNQSNDIQIFPNPTDGDVNLIITNNDRENYSVEIFDAIGQLVIPVIDEKIEQQGTTILKVKTSELSAGIFLMKVVVGERVYTEKLIIKK